MTAEALDHSKPDMIGADLEREVVGVGCHASANEAISSRLVVDFLIQRRKACLDCNGGVIV